jgi:23S rRNA pseudouridine2457 synthase
LSQFSSEGNNPGLGSLYELPNDVNPVGRLDLDSEGLLILTNDRKLNHQLLNPQFGHMRTYCVEVDGIPGKVVLDRLNDGIDIKIKKQNHQTAPAHAIVFDKPPFEIRNPDINRVKHPITSWLRLSLSEGKNRQVRKMTAQLGHPTLRLIRSTIEDLELGDLKSGQIRQLSQKVIYQKLKLTSAT